MILLIDNYDSFTFNLRRYMLQLGLEVEVMRNDAPELLGDLSANYRAIVISPGPKRPEHAGHCLQIVKNWTGRLPMLGVCLGHQVICQTFGASIVRSANPTHGRSTAMELEPSPLFDSIPTGTPFARYHSLVASKQGFPEWLKVTASANSEIMAVEHIEHPTYGVQFHPESVLSLDGHRLLQNFAALANLSVKRSVIQLDLLNKEDVLVPEPPEDLHEMPEQIHAFLHQSPPNIARR